MVSPDSRGGRFGFNPCFPGSSAERRLFDLKPGSKQVSILVFLDQALKAPSGFSVGADADVFQSLFSWIKR